MFILGINAFHGDSSACLLQDGELVAAAEEERFRRVKHWAGFPSEAIKYCLLQGGIAPGRLDHVAINQDSRANILRKVAFLAKGGIDLGLVVDRVKNKRERADMPAGFAAAFPGEPFTAKVHPVEHHVAHLSSAFHVSPFERAAVVSVDGFGDFASAAWGMGNGSELTVHGRVYFPHSLGIFYQALTQFLGFPHYGDEYKVMGLAPYGEPSRVDALRKLVKLNSDGSFELDLQYFRHHKEKISYEWQGGAPAVGALWSATLESLLGPSRKPDEPLEQKHRDIARSTQAVYEEAFFNLLNAVHKRNPVPAIGISGGCGMNSVANGKILLRSPFQDVYVQAAAGDAGGAIGAAFSVWHQQGGPRGFVMSHAYWGPSATDSELGSIIEQYRDVLAEQGCQVAEAADEAELCDEIAKAIAEGMVIGWFQGRMEWGPRALGNRSILCDPRRADIKDTLNLKIKRRESFRPFAPSVLREVVDDWFESNGDVPFMMQVYQMRADKRALVPAVVHVDGSCRLQTVEASANPRYYALISAFGRQTGIPMVLNTSFNENEPVVCKPGEALDCFVRTKMDVLAMGHWIIRRAT